MEHTQLLRIGKMKGGGIIKASARHNLREIQAERGANSNIDPLKTIQNIILRGADNAAGVASLALKLMEQAKVKRRKDEVLGLEVIVSLRPDSGIDENAFFDAAVCWADTVFEIPILSAVIHNDEAAPHCHIIMLPLFDGRMIGSKLIGNRARLLAIQADFFEKVGQPYGLTRQTPQKRYSSVARAKAAALVIGHLVTHPESLNEPTIRDALRDALTDNPMPIMAALRLDMPESKKQKPNTFAGIMTKRFKPEKPIGFNRDENANPIDFAAAKMLLAMPKKERSLSCVDFGLNLPTVEPAKASIQDDGENQYRRDRDEDHAADYWDEVQGKFIKPLTKQKMKSAEIEWVRGAIMAIQR